jgi:hypothetical protein
MTETAMIGIIENATGALCEVVDDLAGFDLMAFTTVEMPAGWPETLVWDVGAQDFVPAPITLRQAAAKAAVDAAAAGQRASRLTDGFGQEMLYLQKEAEARACAADAAPDTASYPLLAAEVGLTGATLAEVAVAVIIRADECRADMADIEAVRLSAKQQIDAASSTAEIETILAGLSWPA